MNKPKGNIRLILSNQKSKGNKAILSQGTQITIPQSNGVTNYIHPSETGEVIKDLNSDIIDTDTNMSGIDMRARLHPIEISGILALDALVQLNFMPPTVLGFTRQKKRLSVSLDGKGRTESVDIVRGEREHQEGKGILSRMGKGISNMMTGGKM